MNIEDQYPVLLSRLTRWLQVRHCPDPEDTAAETLKRCWLRERAGREMTESFVFAVARNLMVSRFRKQQPIVPIERARSEAAPEAETLLDQYLEGMDATERAFAVYRFQGYTHREIAPLLGYSGKGSLLNRTRRLRKEGARDP